MEEIKVFTEVQTPGPLQNDPYLLIFTSVSKSHKRKKGITAKKNSFYIKVIVAS